MNKIYTSIEQSQKLMELGIDVNTADMYYPYSDRVGIGKYALPVEWKIGLPLLPQEIPAWSLSALLGLMPDKISIENESYYLSFGKKGVEFRGPISWDGQKSKSFKMDNILDAAFEMICWLKENNKI